MSGNHLYDALIAPNAENDGLFLEQPGMENLSFRAFITLSAQMAHVLTDAGVKPGDRVVVQAAKSVEMVALYIATLQAGGVFLPLNTAYTRDEVSYFVTDATPRLIVCDGGSQSMMKEIAGDACVLTLNSNGAGTLTKSAATAPTTFEPVARRADDLGALLYTSGTTGRSKGAMMSHENLLSNAGALCELWQITERDTLIHALPIFHTHGLFVALNTSLLAGAKVHFLSAFDVDAIFSAMERATMLMGVPTFYTRLLADPRLSSHATSGMRVFISGSAPLLAETHTAFTARTGHHILERYGMTETNMITSNPYQGERRPGTVGKPLPGVEVRLTDVNESGVGMIEVRGANVFKGYWQMPDKTAEDMRDDGFFITGDLGAFSDDGYLSIVGRAKDLIITGGFNVYPKEIEDVLNEIDGVSESAVFGVPDNDFGESVVAAVVPKVGSQIATDDIREIVEHKVARFKHPRQYVLLETLPRNAMGKVQKNILRSEYAPAI